MGELPGSVNRGPETPRGAERASPPPPPHHAADLERVGSFGGAPLTWPASLRADAEPEIACRRA